MAVLWRSHTLWRGPQTWRGITFTRIELTRQTSWDVFPYGGDTIYLNPSGRVLIVSAPGPPVILQGVE